MSNSRMKWLCDELRDAGPAELEFGPPECPSDRMTGESCDFFDIRGQDNRIRRLIQKRDPENVPSNLEDVVPPDKWDLIYWLEPRKNMIEVEGRKIQDWSCPIVWVEKSAPWFPKLRDKRDKLSKMPGLVGNLARAIDGGMSRGRLWKAVKYHSEKKELSRDQVSMLWNKANRRKELELVDMALKDEQCRAAMSIFQFLYAPCKAAKALAAGLRTLDYPSKEEE